LAETPYYDLYAKMYDQIKINGIKVKISYFTYTGDVPKTSGIWTYIAIDRNGVSDPSTSMTYDKIATYSSAKAKMLSVGGAMT